MEDLKISSQHAETCPVCYGRGIVPLGFYESMNSSWISISTATEQCRSCHGKGFIIV